jgi:hypothetical protein
MKTSEKAAKGQLFSQSWESLFRGYQWPSEQARQWVTDFVQRACSADQTRALVMMGSIVRPLQSVNDVDVLYIYENDPLAFRHHPLDVDIRGLSVTDVHRRFEERHDLIIWALEFGHIICERNSFWSSLRHRFKQQQILPSKQIALDRAEKAEIKLREMEKLGDANAAGELRISALTHRAWYKLLSFGLMPASRPELPSQLRTIGQSELADELEHAFQARTLDRREEAQIEFRK